MDMTSTEFLPELLLSLKMTALVRPETRVVPFSMALFITRACLWRGAK